MSEAIAKTIERLESYVINANLDDDDRDHALLELAALRLQHPDIDPSGMTWAGERLRELLNDYYSGKKDISIDKGDTRSAFSNNGRDPWTGLRWPVAVLLEYDALSKTSNLQGETIQERVAERLHERGFTMGHSKIKAMYYASKDDPKSKQELEDFYIRFPFLRNQEISGK